MALSTSNLQADGLVEEIRHSLHQQHPLSIYQSEGLSSFETSTCKLCGDQCFRPSYGCLQCDFLVHKFCAGLPAEFPCPSHPSKHIKRQDEYREFECGSCSTTSLGFPYSCGSCGFDLDFGCVFFREMDEGFCQMGRYDGIKCLLCAKGCTGAVIGDPDSEIFIHRSCDELPWKIQHPAHPIHLLNQISSPIQFKCSSCLVEHDAAAAYRCSDSDCTYYLDFECAFLFNGCRLHHLDIHPHLLSLTEKKRDDELCCIICHKSCSGPTYTCSICQIHFHKSCIELEEIQHHPSHPFHRLKRTTKQQKFKCHVCLKDRNSKPYRCEDCDFDLDFDCAFVVPREKFQGMDLILSNIHKHPLALMDRGTKSEGKEVQCSICRDSCSFPIHGCGVCDIYVHKSCATSNVPNDIQHPLIQGHSLKLSLGEYKCNICLRKASPGIHYGCSDGGCKVKLDVKCALNVDRTVITFDGHSHPLIFLEDFNGYARCGACKKYENLSAMFHCPTCDLNLHLLCGPLPCSLKQEIHLETLILKDSHVDERRIFDEFFCDSCEEPRDPRECVYYCERCNYAAEFKCIMPELVLALTGKSGDLELRTLGRWPLSGKVASRGLSAEDIQKCDVGGEVLHNTESLTLGHIMGSLTEDEKKELDAILDRNEKLLEDLGGDGSVTGNARLGSDEDFTQLVAGLDSKELTLLEKKWDMDMSFVQAPNGGDLFVPEKFLSVYSDLHSDYGDIGAESGLSPRMKSVFFLHLCQTIESMWTVTVLDITEEQLADWWISLKAVRKAGFRIQFATDALKAAVHTYFGTRATTSQNNLAQQIELQEEKVRKKKTEQEQIESELKQYKEYLKSRESSTVRDYISEAPKMMYKTASEVVFGLG